MQWATGSVGVAAIKGLLEHPELELAGCWVHSEDKSGKDVGEIIGWSPLGVRATTSVDISLAPKSSLTCGPMPRPMMCCVT